MELAERKCAACRGDTPTLSAETVAEHVARIPGWQVKEGSVERTFQFTNFKEALEFFNTVAQIAEEEDHHPDMSITKWRNVSLAFTSHAAGGLTENDFIMAAKINQLQFP